MTHAARRGNLYYQPRVVSVTLSGWVDVEWDNGIKNSYRYGKEDAFDVRVRQNLKMFF